MKIAGFILLGIGVVGIIVTIIKRRIESFIINADRAVVLKDEDEKEQIIILERCPFCGANVANLYEDDEGAYQIVCDSQLGGCGSASGLFKDEIDAIKAWNTRKNNK